MRQTIKSWRKAHGRCSRAATIAAAAGCLLVAAGQASATSFGLNFLNNDAAADGLAPTDVAGAPGYEQSHWNNEGNWSGWGSNLTNAMDNTGATISGVQFLWNSPYTATVSGQDHATANQKLMRDFLASNTKEPAFNDDGTYPLGDQDNEPDAWVAGLSGWLASQNSPSYSVVVYVDGQGNPDDWRTGEYWLQAQDGTKVPTNSNDDITLGADLTPHIFAADRSNFDGTFVQATATSASSITPATTSSNYIVFTGLTADRFILRTNEVLADNYASPFNAIQIIAAPGAPVWTPGDANMDGVVNGLDLQLIANNWQGSDDTWSQGDFNGDGLVNGLDLQLLANNWQAGVNGASAQTFAQAAANYSFSAVPEPTSAALLLASLGGLALRRRRRNHVA